MKRASEDRTEFGGRPPRILWMTRLSFRVPPSTRERSQGRGVPSLIACLSCSRNSGVSTWPWTATACCTAISNSSFSLSAEIATVHFDSLGKSRQ